MALETEFISVLSTNNEICRLCLHQGNLQTLDNFKKDFPSIIPNFFELSLGCSFPDNVCENCLHELTHISEFMEKCKRSNDILKQFEEECGKLENDAAIQIEILNVEDSEPNDNALANESDEINIPEEFKIEIEGGYIGVTAQDFQLDSERTDLELPLQDIEDNINLKSNGVKDVDLSKRCQRCGQVVVTMGDHYKVSKNCRPRNIKCVECNMAFSTSLKLKTHMTSHHWKETYPRFMCHVCAKIFKYEINLKRHLRNHEVDKQFICEKCGKGYTTKIHLEDHLHLHTGARPYACCYCDKTFHIRGVWGRHQNRHLKTMLRGKAAFTKNVTQTENSIQIMFACDICNMVFESEHSLNLHKQIHDRSFQCDHCGKEFASEDRLRGHAAVHGPARAFVCSQCNKSFKRQIFLDVHTRVHTGEKPYECTVCGKTFTQKPHLTNHMLLHTGEKMFECQVCNKSFALKGNLTVHLRVHTGEKPYECHVCRQCFRDSSARKRHIRSKHGEEEVHLIGSADSSEIVGL